MAQVESVLAELKSKGKEKTQLIFAKHGMPVDRTYGVSVADLKLVAKANRGDQDLAAQLYASGIMDAMYLAGMLANGAKMTKAQLQEWAEAAAGLSMVFEYVVPWLTVESPYARELALEWIDSDKEHLAAAGWNTYSGLVAILPDESLDSKEIELLLNKISTGIHQAPNRVRQTMNAFIISVGCYVPSLAELAKGTAREIGKVTVDMGDTSCKTPSALEYIAKVEGMGRAGKKRKTLRC